MTTTHANGVTAKLSTLDRFLPLRIGLAMAGGLLLGRLIPDLNTSLERIRIDTVSLPTAIGLLAMMYPVLVALVHVSLLAKHRFHEPRTDQPLPTHL